MEWTGEKENLITLLWDIKEHHCIKHNRAVEWPQKLLIPFLHVGGDSRTQNHQTSHQADLIGFIGGKQLVIPLNCHYDRNLDMYTWLSRQRTTCDVAPLTICRTANSLRRENFCNALIHAWSKYTFSLLFGHGCCYELVINHKTCNIRHTDIPWLRFKPL